MAQMKNVEKRIWDLEGFNVRILHEDGRDVRADRGNVPQYSFERAAKNSMSVAAWIAQRFSQQFPGFRVEVLNASGEAVAGNMLLGTVRDTYLED